MIAQPLTLNHCLTLSAHHQAMIGGDGPVRIWASARGMAARLGVMAVVAALAGCAQAPVPHEAMTTADLARARTAGAAEHAAVELARAEAKLQEARAAIRAKAHERARGLAEQALVDAELAEIKAQAAQEQASARRLRERVALQHRQLAPADNGDWVAYASSGQNRGSLVLSPARLPPGAGGRCVCRPGDVSCPR
jgi:Domain of unknown function (DUF4398)